LIKLNSKFLGEAENMGIFLPDRILSQVEDYLSLLKKWSQVINLSSIKDPLKIFRYHFLESFYCCNFIGKKGKLADIGSGAGFPGLAIKLMRPGLKVWLIEPRRKRVFFLKEVIRKLDLRGVEVIQQRAEAWQAAPFHQINYITSRAMGKLDIIAQWASKVLAEEGIILLFISNKDTRKLGEAGLSLREKHRLPTRREAIIALCHPKKDVSRETFSL